MNQEIKVGSSVWVFDQNCRVYKRDARGISSGTPIYRLHWVEQEVTGETSRSWIIGRGYAERKVPKKGEPQGVLFSLEEVERDTWKNDHTHKISEAVRRASYEQLKAIAEILNYHTTPAQ